MTTNTEVTTRTVVKINLIALLTAVGYQPSTLKQMASKFYKAATGSDCTEFAIDLDIAEKIKADIVKKNNSKYADQWDAIKPADFSTEKYIEMPKIGGSMAAIDAIVDEFKRTIKKFKVLDLEQLKKELEALELVLATK